jgi:chorismate synthase
MGNLDYRTAGESHGQALIVLLEGLPAGLPIDLELVNGELRRRQGGYGRGGRMKIEQDTVNILSGIRAGVTIGSPLAVQIVNKDWRIDTAPVVNRPRPGHADLAGSLKWLTTDCRETLERASARETAARVAAGALARCLLEEFGIVVVGFVRRIGGWKRASTPLPLPIGSPPPATPTKRTLRTHWPPTR